MGLQAEPPPRVGQAVLDAPAGCSLSRSGPVHRLQQQPSGTPGRSNISGAAPSCGYTSFSSSPLVSARRRPGLWADAHPVDRRPGRAWFRSSRPPPRTRAACSASTSGVVQLQQRLAAGADDERAGHASTGQASHVAATAVGEIERRGEPCRRRGRPCRRSRCRRTGRPRGARSFSRPVHRLQPVNRQNTAGRPAWRALALQGVEDLLDRVRHGRPGPVRSVGSAMPTSANPLRRSRHESHSPHARPAGVRRRSN